jgi:hypothetical protein
LNKIFSTLEYFGSTHRYLVCGYPPFLKHLIDVAADRRFPLERYTLMALLGGEGNSDHPACHQRFRHLYAKVQGQGAGRARRQPPGPYCGPAGTPSMSVVSRDALWAEPSATQRR